MNYRFKFIIIFVLRYYIRIIIELQLDYNAAFPYNRRAYYNNSFAIIKKTKNKKQIRTYVDVYARVSPFEGIKILLYLSNLFRTNKRPEE